MAEEAFALSPINARPSVPGEADYEAIREAFMETARGRWFLAEYAKRNRTADTSLVLEAVTRLEANLAAQKQAPALSLIAALGAIRSAVRQAKATAIEAMPRFDADETLKRARDGARIIREIAWTLRECGADTRICDLLDTHVQAIEAAQQAQSGDGREEVLASYDLLMQRIEQMADGSAAAMAQAAPAPAAEKHEPVAAEPREASVTPLFKSQASETLAETVTISRSPAPMAAPPVTEPVAVAEEAVAPIREAVAELAATMVEAEAEAEEHDLAVLDMVAAEMGMLDESEPDVLESQVYEDQVVEPAVVETTVVAEPESMQAEIGTIEVLSSDVGPDQTLASEASSAVAPGEEIQAAAIAAPAPAAEPQAVNPDLMTLAQIAEVALAPEPVEPEPVQPEPEAASLGAALIANGVIAHPAAPVSDPLAPIRKMTQAEKIAFFS